MLIHGMSSSEEFLKVVKADDQSDRKTNRTPETVTPTDPVPELEHIGFIDTECGYCGRVRAKRDEVFGNVGLILGVFEEPVASGFGIRNSFLSGERLASNNEQCSLRIAFEEDFRKVGSVDVGNE